MNPLLDYSILSTVPPALLGLVLVWSLIWKGIALWKAAKKNNKYWFVAILVINTVGIFEILYIFLFSKINITNKNISIKKNKKYKSKQKE
ncbi:MAG: DUF5652 family protein [Nanoarchaeota archaeon]|mgnify:CR=1 FL=1